MGKRALVIGGSGFLGASIVKKLYSEGWEVFSIGRRQQNPTDCTKYFQVDRTVPGTLKKISSDYRFQLVVDCASYNGQDTVEAVDAFAGNIEHYVFISTDYVYAFDPQATFPVREDALKQSETAYAEGKLQCETVLMNAWNERKFPVTILRPPHILGEGKGLGADVSQGRDPNLLNNIREGKGLTLIAEGQLLIQPVWNKEIAECISHIARMDSSYGQIFNCTGSQCITMVRYYEIIADFLGVSLKYDSIDINDFRVKNPDKANYVRHRIYDLSQLAKLTNFYPQYRVEDAIYETAEWMASR
ncbi:NAD-dependent epimerase/dehydratase family protein [Paenibacillus filicis]|uniref:NAD-dependent epimerase/dehydratase family protein n=1 Tax=Paenibacillus gyeongsangnamensis TaxID=3388067 RepID=A0ABT4Q5J5_9BACL|nr:NAD-dependent epimerase/dehydratase family protein [Paenibacillus filicis]MCZ8512153.1 NAD-dependent epimerase/dehydratase family protein [Paenibacillus filicis]